MSDISASERRLSAALDRIDQLLEAGVARPAAAGGGGEARVIAELRAENARLTAELSALRAAQETGSDAGLAEARARLAEAGEQAARLAAANDDLAAANRALIDAVSGSGEGDQASIEALEAEVEALRAARSAEIAQLGDIMLELDRLLAGEDDHGQQAEAAAALPEVAGDTAGVPETDEGNGAAASGDAARQEGEA